MIKKFIKQKMPLIKDDEISNAYYVFSHCEREVALEDLSKHEGLDVEKLKRAIENYLYTGINFINDDIIQLMKKPPMLNETITKAKRVKNKIMDFIDTFMN